jgi:hypothetical protein
LAATALPASPAGSEALDGDEIDDAESDLIDSPDVVTTGTEAIDQIDPAGDAAVDAAPERVTPQLTSSQAAAREEAAPGVPATPATPPEDEPHEQ